MTEDPKKLQDPLKTLRDAILTRRETNPENGLSLAKNMSVPSAFTFREIVHSHEQPIQLRHYRPFVPPLVSGQDRAVLDNLTLDRALLFECKVRARFVMVAKVGGQRRLEMTGIQDDEVVQAFPSYGSDPALGISILPGTLRCC